MNHTPKEEYRLTGRLTGRDAEDALDALASVETERMAALSIGSWAPSADDHAEELDDLANLVTYYDLPPEVKGRIEAAVNSIRDRVFDRYARYSDWLCERS